MADLTSEQRREMIDALATWLRDNVGDVRNDVELQLLHGIEADYSEDLVEPKISRNGAATLTIRINGGAQHTQRA